MPSSLLVFLTIAMYLRASRVSPLARPLARSGRHTTMLLILVSPSTTHTCVPGRIRSWTASLPRDVFGAYRAVTAIPVVRENDDVTIMAQESPEKR